MSGAAADGQRPAVFTVDTDRALEALRVTWGNAYAVCFDDAIEMGGDRWQAWRLGGHGIRLAGAPPDELNAARSGPTGRMGLGRDAPAVADLDAG